MAKSEAVTYRDPAIVGVVPAIYTPFHDDRSVDEKSLQAMADRLASMDGIGGVFCTGHAGEVASLSPQERNRVMRLVSEAVGGRKPVLAGVYSDSLDDSVQIAADARAAGVDVVTIFPPNVFWGGAAFNPDVPYNWFKTIADRVDIKICAFQFPLSSGIGYPVETLVKIASLPQVVAVKEGSGAPHLYEANLIALRQFDPTISVLTSNNQWWIADLVYGGDGIISGSSPVMPELQIELWNAMRDCNLAEARKVQNRIRPLLEVFYKDPAIDMHNRMKVALNLMGQLPSAMVRPPLVPIGDAERAEIRKALEATGLL